MMNSSSQGFFSAFSLIDDQFSSLSSKEIDENQRICSVCFSLCSSDLFRTDFCCNLKSKHRRREVCDDCLYQYICSQLNCSLMNSIQCPERECSIYLSSTSICQILFLNQNEILLENFLREQQFQGKTDQWIQRFTIPCPGCQVPIEKNGGCDEMICIRCQTHFYWSLAKKNFQMNSKEKHSIQREHFVCLIHPLIDGILLVLLLLCLILSSVIYFK